MWSRWWCSSTMSRRYQPLTQLTIWNINFSNIWTAQNVYIIIPTELSWFQSSIWKNKFLVFFKYLFTESLQILCYLDVKYNYRVGLRSKKKCVVFHAFLYFLLLWGVKHNSYHITFLQYTYSYVVFSHFLAVQKSPNPLENVSP